MKKILVLIISLNILFLAGCEREFELTADKSMIFHETPVYKLAKAIERDDLSKFNSLLEEISLTEIQYQEEYFGFSLLHWTIYRNDLNYSRILLEFGSNPNALTKDGSNCIIEASSSGNFKAVELLTGYNVNINCITIDSLNGNFIYMVPIIEASHSNFKTVKALVTAGANPKIEIMQGSTRICPLRGALLNRNIDIVNYLVFECKVNFKDFLSVTASKDTLYISNYLRDFLFDLNSDDYKKKVKLINFLSQNNIDYFSTEIPKHYYENYDSLYLSKY